VEDGRFGVATCIKAKEARLLKLVSLARISDKETSKIGDESGS
jgi:hypothetical protein